VDRIFINSNIRALLVINIAISCFLLMHPGDCHAMGSNPVPTVTVIDEETGKPIEGAVAIAIWRKPSWTKGGLFEGGGYDVTKIEEVVSDSDGNIYISGFWSWHLFGYDPTLNIYKPDYVCWDDKAIYIDAHHIPLRTDFDKKHRIARMVKWPDEFSFIGHQTFVGNVTRGDDAEAPKKLFRKAFRYETPFYVKEENERDKKRKEEMEEQKKRREMQ
jgi:hypothetical protein